MHRFIFSAIILFCFHVGTAQQKVWVFLRDKQGVSFDPYTYFEPQAIDRRLREGLSLHDSTDFPLNEQYVSLVASHCDNICGRSRWFNAVACEADEAQVISLQQLACVVEVVPMYASAVLAKSNPLAVEIDTEDAVLRAQTERMQCSLLHEKGFSGNGVRVAIFDAGFRGLITDEAFGHIIRDNQVRATYDFVKDKKFVFDSHTHGTNVLSCIAGIKNGTPMGCATEADFLLARTEQAVWESRIEEENWIESLEWADKWGADIVNSSLGYTSQFYFPKDMNGRRSIISRAANMAARKGILVVNSAGNEGDARWEVIGAPADADSVLTIGAIDPWTGYHTDFSSFGPTSDMRLKPNLCAFGYAITTDGNNATLNSGTSFSCPLVAGFAACIRQMHPEWTVKQLFEELQHSGDLYPYYDYAHGYGIPQASYFLPDSLAADTSFGLDIYYESGLRRFRVAVKDTLRKFVDYKAEWHEHKDYSQPMDYVYSHVDDGTGVLITYQVAEPGVRTGLFIDDIYDDHCIIRVHWRGRTLAYTVEELRKRTKPDHE